MTFKIRDKTIIWTKLYFSKIYTWFSRFVWGNLNVVSKIVKDLKILSQIIFFLSTSNIEYVP